MLKFRRNAAPQCENDFENELKSAEKLITAKN